jgi:AcrR family transcriptional regulator
MDDIVDIGRRQRKRQAVHDSLLTAARELFEERGIARTTIDDIAAAADVARQTVFNHFPYKEAFALELGSALIQTAAHRTQALLESGAPAVEALYRSAEWIVEMAINQGEVAVTVARELLHVDGERASRAAQRFPLQKLFEAILVQAREEGGIREDLPLDLVAWRLSSAVTSLISQSSTRDWEILKRDLSIFFDIEFNGITERSA